MPTCDHCTADLPPPDEQFPIDICDDCAADPEIAALYEKDLMSDDDQWQVREL